MTTEPPFNAAAGSLYLISIRERLGFTQALMAQKLGMSLRAYSDLENFISKTRMIHCLAAERLSLQEAKLRCDYQLATGPILHEAEMVINQMRSGQ